MAPKKRRRSAPSKQQPESLVESDSTPVADSERSVVQSKTGKLLTNGSTHDESDGVDALATDCLQEDCEEVELFRELVEASSGRTISVDEFFRTFWGKQPYLGRISPHSDARDERLLFMLQRNVVHNGDIEATLKDCRREDNSPLSVEEIGAQASALSEGKRTIDQPFCVGSAAAQQLRNDFIVQSHFQYLHQLRQHVTNKLCPSCTGNAPAPHEGKQRREQAIIPCDDPGQCTDVDRRFLFSDVEVGVYFSETGGQPTDWHFDNNHNFTIQLFGQKEWQVAPAFHETNGEEKFHSSAGKQSSSEFVVGSRSRIGLLNKPKNRFEQVVLGAASIPEVNPMRAVAIQEKTLQPELSTYRLEEGCILYLPPGWWHEVRCVGAGTSISADLRVGNIAAAKWNAEVMFAEAMLSAAKEDIGTSRHSETQAVQRSLTVQRSLCGHPHSRCRVLRPLPAEHHLCNGMARGVSVEYLFMHYFLFSSSRTAQPHPIDFNSAFKRFVEKEKPTFQHVTSKSMKKSLRRDWSHDEAEKNQQLALLDDDDVYIGVHPLVAISLKKIISRHTNSHADSSANKIDANDDQNTLVVQLFAESSLTSMEYLWVEVYCCPLNPLTTAMLELLINQSCKTVATSAANKTLTVHSEDRIYLLSDLVPKLMTMLPTGISIPSAWTMQIHMLLNVLIAANVFFCFSISGRPRLIL